MGKSAPKAPSPKATAAASTSTNVGTAIANTMMGNVNQVTPDGSLSYSQSGTHSWRDPYTGKTYDIPTFTATQSLSPEQQAIKQQQDAAGLNLASLGNSLSGSLGQQLTGNFKLGNEATEARLMELGRARLDPALDQRRQSMETRLSNSGIMPGSAAYDTAMANLYQGENDAYNQLMLQGRGMANQELLTEDNQRINQISALLNGGQVSQPNFVGTGAATIPTTDVGGLINANYQQQMAGYQQQQAGMGGLFSGIGAGIGGMIGLSDDDAKTDKEKIGEAKGMGLYEYRYKGEPKSKPKHVGLMASEVQKKKPSAVKRGGDGMRYVDYGSALGLMGA